MARKSRRKRIKTKEIKTNPLGDEAAALVSSLYPSVLPFSSVIGGFEGRLPSAGKRAAFRKLLRLWVEGDLESFLERVREDEVFFAESVGRLVRRLEGEGLAPATIHSFYLPMLKGFLRYCGVRVDWDFVKARVDIPKRRTLKIDRAPSLNELRMMILGARSRRLKVLIHFLAVTGLRIGEALSLKRENLDFDSKPPVVRVITEKTNIPREVPLTREIVDVLKRWLEENPSSYVFPNYSDPSKPPTFQNIWQDFLDLTKRLGINKRDPSNRGWMLHIHSLRKFYKTRLEEAGVNPLVIEMWMGHELGVVGAYFRPSRKMILEEWSKAEPALTLFAETEDQLQRDREIAEMREDIKNLWEKLSLVLAELEAYRDMLHAAGIHSISQLTRKARTSKSS